MPDKTPFESLSQREAFEYYFMLGLEDAKNRSLQKVADKFNKSVQTVKLWSTKFGWTKRVEEREKSIAVRYSNAIEDQVVKIRKENLELLGKLKTKFKENLDKNKINPKSTTDLERILKLELLHLGEATERVENLDIEKARNVVDEILGLDTPPEPTKE